MIGKLKGIIDDFGDDWVLIDVQGVCYQVHCASRTLQRLPQKGEAATISIETIVRENEITLYGFYDQSERAWFQLLTTVQGVGAKVALAVLGTLSTSELASAIALQDKAQITRAPGIGPKVASRLLVELKDKAPALGAIDSCLMAVQSDLGAGAATSSVTDAVSALQNLGYPAHQASAAVAAALKAEGDEAAAEVLIRVALKELSK